MTDVEMKIVLEAFVRVFGPGPGAPTGTANVEAEAFWRGGFDEYATGSTGPRRFHEGQPVMVVQLDKRRTKFRRVTRGLPHTQDNGSLQLFQMLPFLSQTQHRLGPAQARLQ